LIEEDLAGPQDATLSAESIRAEFIDLRCLAPAGSMFQEVLILDRRMPIVTRDYFWRLIKESRLPIPDNSGYYLHQLRPGCFVFLSPSEQAREHPGRIDRFWVGKVHSVALGNNEIQVKWHKLSGRAATRRGPYDDAQVEPDTVDIESIFCVSNSGDIFGNNKMLRGDVFAKIEKQSQRYE